MLKLKIKNFFRFVIGFCTYLLPGTKRYQQYLYCNLIGGKVSGGPDRFLRNLVASSDVKDQIHISNWSLKFCRSVLVFSSSWGDTFSWLCKLYKVKSVLRVDGFYVPDDIIDEKYQHTLSYRRFVNHRLSRDLQLFDHVIYQSSFSKHICDQYLYKRVDNYSVIPNGINVSHFKPATSQIKNDVLTLIVLGKHYPKHLNFAISIFKGVLEYQAAKLIIVGPMRNGAELVEEYIDNSGLDLDVREKITCIGTVSFDVLPTVLSNADIFLHVKVGDWCPNAVLEAMGCGLPVVCPDFGGTNELVGEAGISVVGPEWQINEALVEGMVKAVIDVQTDLSSYRQKARARILNEFNITDIAKRYLKILEYTHE